MDIKIHFNDVSSVPPIFKALMSYEHIYVIGLNDHVWRLHSEEEFCSMTERNAEKYALHFGRIIDHVFCHCVCSHAV